MSDRRMIELILGHTVKYNQGNCMELINGCTLVFGTDGNFLHITGPKKVFEVFDQDDEFRNTYCTTTDEELALDVMHMLKGAVTCPYTNYEMVERQLDHKKPLITWLFFVDDRGITVSTEDKNSDFEVNWAWQECYKIKAESLYEAILKLKQIEGVDYYALNNTQSIATPGDEHA